MGFALGFDPSGIASAAIPVSDLFQGAREAARAEPKPGGLTGDTYYGILDSYLEAARGVCKSMSKTVHHLSTKNSLGVKPLKDLHVGFPEVPSLP